MKKGLHIIQKRWSTTFNAMPILHHLFFVLLLLFMVICEVHLAIVFLFFVSLVRRWKEHWTRLFFCMCPVITSLYQTTYMPCIGYWQEIEKGKGGENGQYFDYFTFCFHLSFFCLHLSYFVSLSFLFPLPEWMMNQRERMMNREMSCWAAINSTPWRVVSFLPVNPPSPVSREKGKRFPNPFSGLCLYGLIWFMFVSVSILLSQYAYPTDKVMILERKISHRKHFFASDGGESGIIWLTSSTF